jgi:hypothetical protein
VEHRILGQSKYIHFFILVSRLASTASFPCLVMRLRLTATLGIIFNLVLRTSAEHITELAPWCPFIFELSTRERCILRIPSSSRPTELRLCAVLNRESVSCRYRKASAPDRPNGSLLYSFLATNRKQLKATHMLVRRRFTLLHSTSLPNQRILNIEGQSRAERQRASPAAFVCLPSAE